MFRVHRVTAIMATAVALALGMAACGSADAGLSSAAAAKVGDTEIAADTLTGVVDAVAGDQEMDEAQRLGTERDILSSLIQAVVAVDLAADNDISFSDEEADALYEEAGEQAVTQAEQIGMDKQAFLDYVLLPAEAIERLAEQFVSDEDVRAAFEEEAGTGQHDVATLSHILVDTEAEAEDALERINGGEDFAEVAAEVSTDGSAAQGGALGEDVPLSDLVEPFADAAREAPLGEVVGPVQTQFGWHLIRVDERSTVTFEDRAPQLRTELAQPQLQAALQEAMADADVTVSSRLGVWDGETGAVQPADAVGEAPTLPADEAPLPSQSPPPPAPDSSNPGSPTAVPTDG